MKLSRLTPLLLLASVYACSETKSDPPEQSAGAAGVPDGAGGSAAGSDNTGGTSAGQGGAPESPGGAGVGAEGGLDDGGSGGDNGGEGGRSGDGGAPSETGGAGSGGEDTGSTGGGAGGSDAGGGGSGNDTCGALGQACCEDSCDNSLACLSGSTCSCVGGLFDDYVLRTDGKVLHEAGSSETTVLNAETGLALTGVTSVQGGNYHGCASLEDGTVWCWRTHGTNGNFAGQLGNGSLDTSGVTYRATRVLKAPNQPLTGVGSLASGSTNTACAITEGGNMHCWGQLNWVVNGGAALTSGYAVPITTDGATLLEGVLQASVAPVYACVVRDTGTANEVWCWGNGSQENLGIGDTTNYQYPTSKTLGLSEPKKVVTTEYSCGATGTCWTTCAIDGANVRCWGANPYGEVGSGNTNAVHGPTLVVLQAGTTALTNPLDLQSAAGVTCVLRQGNTIWCWGGSYYGGALTSYAANHGVTNVVALGRANAPVFVTSDGVYHVAAATKVVNCGLLD